jgi:hypothetical protein
MNYKPYLNTNKTIKYEEIAQIFNKFSPNDNNYVETILNPKGGNLFIYYNPSKPKDYKVDGFTWYNRGGHKPTPKINPILSKSYFDVKYANNKSSEDFQKVLYELIDNTTASKRKETPVIVHYLGCCDEEQLENFKPGPHWNVKDKAMASGFKPTLPSTINYLKGLLSMSPAHQVYKNSSKVGGARDMKQCQNIKYVKSD